MTEDAATIASFFQTNTPLIKTRKVGPQLVASSPLGFTFGGVRFLARTPLCS